MYILVIDEGTTSTRAAIYNKNGKRIALASKNIENFYPKPGWQEQDPIEIWAGCLGTIREAISLAKIEVRDIAGLGITNQRETTVLRNKKTGKPYYNAVVRSCRRGSDFCSKLIKKGVNAEINEKTGLVIDATYSASKIRWILDNVKGVKEDIKKGEVLFGTIDTWLLRNLTGGMVHATDPSNASRTMLYNIFENRWDDALLKLIGIDNSLLPEVRNTIDDFGRIKKDYLGYEIPIVSICGDQQSALFGQACFNVGDCKNTYGTSNVPLVYIGEKSIKSERGLLTLAWMMDNKPYYAVGASILTTGEVIKRFRDKLNLIYDAEESEDFARSVKDTNGVYFVPAFQGLGAPHWDMYARGMIIGLTSGANKAHLVKAGLDSIAYQTKDLLDQIEKETGIEIKNMKVDGGASNNDYLMQFQADLLDIPVVRPSDTETTALGSAYLAGLGSGIWKDLDEIQKLWKASFTFVPSEKRHEIQDGYVDWQRAVEFSKGWLNH